MSLAYDQYSFWSLLDILKPSIDLDQVAIDLHFFFKRSAARRKDYKIVESVTEFTTHCMKKHLEKHLESCWLSIENLLFKYWNR